MGQQIDFEISNARVPDGVSRKLWTSLKAALRQAMAQPQPGSGALEVTDLGITVTGTQAEGATARFTWTYVNGGDYDQNGEVNIGDLTPLGLHFGKTAQSADWAAARMADGDGNGEINIADVTPIGVNYGGRVEGYRLQTAATAEASVWTDVSLAPVLMGDAAAPPGGGALGFALDLPDPLDGDYYRVEPFAGTLRGPGSNNMLCEVPVGSLPPQAALDAGPEQGPSPLTAVFDASASLDPDGGSIAHYEWDVDGIPDNGPLSDGFEIDGGAESTLELMWYSLGLHQVRVRVTDDEGDSDIEAHSVQTLAGATWHVSEPDGAVSGNLDGDFAVLETEGKPAIVYKSRVGSMGGNTRILFARSLDSQGADWIPSALVTDVITSGPILACATGSRLFCIIRFDNGDGMFQMIDSTDNGQTWGPPQWAGPTGVGLDPAILLSGNPNPLVFSLGHETKDVLHCIAATDASASAWNPPALLPLPSAKYGRCQVAFVGGTPSMAIQDRDKGDLLYCRAQTASGSSWNAPITVDYEESVGAGCSLGHAEGWPAIAYYNATQRKLMFVRALDSEGNTWDTPQVVDSETDGNIYLTSLNQRPALVYTLRDSQDICFRQAVDLGGLVWDKPLVIDSGVVSVASTRPDHDGLVLANLGGNPACAYMLFDSGPPGVYHLRYASCY